MITTMFLIENKLKQIRLFKKTFLLVDISKKLVIKMSFLSFSNIKVNFVKLNTLTWRYYDTAKILPPTS